MRLFMAILSIMCVPAFAQDRAAIQQELRLRQQSLYVRTIAGQISLHQPILLPGTPLGPKVTITVTDIKGDDGYTLQLGGIEISTDSLAVQADELHFRWATGEVELNGNVHLKRIAQ